jgi:GntR family transcriptional regulator
MAEPMYWRIAQNLRQEIESGHLRPGEQLPTELELRGQYDASRNTVRDAIKWLTSRGLVETRPGQGTFVVQKIDPFVTTLSVDSETGLGGGEGQAAFTEITARHRTPGTDSPSVEIQKASGNIAARLRVPEGTSLVSRHQRRYIDGTPWSLQTSFYRMDLVRQGAERLIDAEGITEGTVAYLTATLGIMQVGYRDRIVVRAPGETEARFFGLPDDGRVAVFEIFRTAFHATADGPAPFRLTVSVFPTDRNQFVINVGQVPDQLAAPALQGPLPHASSRDLGQLQASKRRHHPRSSLCGCGLPPPSSRPGWARPSEHLDLSGRFQCDQAFGLLDSTRLTRLSYPSQPLVLCSLYRSQEGSKRDNAEQANNPVSKDGLLRQDHPLSWAGWYG